MEDNIREEVRKIGSKVDELYSALIGSRVTKDGGLVKRVQEQEQDLEEFKVSMTLRMESLEKQKIKTAAYVHILYAAAGAVAMAIFTLIIKK